MVREKASQPAGSIQYSLNARITWKSSESEEGILHRIHMLDQGSQTEM